MLRQKAYVKVTNRGAVAKVIREHYLRDDIPCGILGCTECEPLLAGLTDKPALLDPREQTRISKSVGHCHILLPDTNILLHHLDVLEAAPFRDVVILQTVLDEVKGNSTAVHKRIRSLIAQTERRFYVFSNENHRSTFIEKNESETDNDRNDRSIRRATAWYVQHLANQSSLEMKEFKVVLLTNDGENAKLARADGLIAIRLRDYCEGYAGVLDLESKDGTVALTTLLDMLESAAVGVGESDSGIEYEEYLSPGLLQAGIKAGQLLQGSLQVSPYGSHKATVTTEGTTVHIEGRQNLNRGIQGDIVVIEILPNASGLTREECIEELNEEKEQESELMTLPAVESIPAEPSPPIRSEVFGKVVGVTRRSLRCFCGSIDRKTIRAEVGKQNVLVVPLDRRMPRIRIRTSNATGMANQRLLVSVDGWERRSKYPHGHLVRVLGTAGEKATETEVILLEHDVAYADFTPQVLSCLPEAGNSWKPKEEDYQKRADLRHLNVCSVDPPGCTDIDDALHAVVLPNGNFEVGVHIADVTHFVQADTPLDHEATQRSTTVYLVDRRIDMLPSLLGTNLCSLKSNVERFAFSCIWELDPQAQIVSTRFTKSIICSKASFTYDEAQARLDSKNDDLDALTTSLQILNNLAKRLRARRIEAGALTLASPEVRFTLEMETQNPVDVILKEMKDANSMVEEFMLLANISVAKKIHEAFPDTAVLRRHPAPPSENFSALNRALTEQNVQPLDTTTSKTLAESLDRAHLVEDPFFNRLVRIMATRCMYQAQYFPAGTVGYESFWHYGLATPIYTHFTSPIRRYADVLVHRLLAATIQAEAKDSGIATFDKTRLEEICSNMNHRHRMAQQAQRSSIELYTHLFFRGKTVTEDAYIIKLMANGLVALIPKYGIEGLIHLDADQLTKANLKYDAETGRFTRANSPILTLFLRISITLTVEEVESSQRQRLVVRLVEPSLGSDPEISKAENTIFLSPNITHEDGHSLERSTTPSSAGQKRPMEKL